MWLWPPSPGRISSVPVHRGRDTDRRCAINVASLDLNLLVSLDALLRDRSVTRAAQRLGLSQPALSSALRRLRRHFGDELLVRVGNAYQLTPMGVLLLARVAVALDGAERVFGAEPDFDAARTVREFSVVTSDYALAVVGGPLLAALAARAPQARLRFRQPALAQVPDVAADLRTSDALVFPHGFFPELPHLDVFRDRWVCVVDVDNHAVGATATVEELGKLPWVAALAEPRAYTPAHRQLEMQGVSLDIEVVTDGFLAVPRLVAGTDRAALVQERLIHTLPQGMRLRVLETPYEAPPLVEALWWHPLSDQDPEHQLLRSVFADVALALAAPA